MCKSWTFVFSVGSSQGFSSANITSPKILEPLTWDAKSWFYKTLAMKFHTSHWHTPLIFVFNKWHVRFSVRSPPLFNLPPSGLLPLFQQGKPRLSVGDFCIRPDPNENKQPLQPKNNMCPFDPTLTCGWGGAHQPRWGGVGVGWDANVHKHLQAKDGRLAVRGCKDQPSPYSRSFHTC